MTREFDVSHLSRTCPVCGEFGRFANTVVVERFNALAADPPGHLHWERLDRLQKWLIAERLSRKDHSIEDIEVRLPMAVTRPSRKAASTPAPKRDIRTRHR